MQRDGGEIAGLRRRDTPRIITETEEIGVVGDHRYAVGADLYIQLHSVDSEFACMLKGGECVFHAYCCTSSVAEDERCARSARVM